MDSKELLLAKSETLLRLIEKVTKENINQYANSAKLISDAINNGKTIFWCGNGGSAAESSHLAVELIGRFKENRLPLPSISLNSDTSAITCIANDFGYEEIFARQLEGLGRAGDVLVVLSTSGQSPNIIKALQRANKLGIKSVALLGKDGGKAKDFADIFIVVDSDETARIQEIHLLLGHIFCEFVENNLRIE
jgi:D-sedoheptulose 7-phosphate isomerase